MKARAVVWARLGLLFAIACGRSGDEGSALSGDGSLNPGDGGSGAAGETGGSAAGGSSRGGSDGGGGREPSGGGADSGGVSGADSGGTVEPDAGGGGARDSSEDSGEAAAEALLSCVVDPVLAAGSLGESCGALSACVRENCASQLEACFDTSEAPAACQGYLDCASGQEDACTSDCEPSVECLECLSSGTQACAAQSCLFEALQCQGAAMLPEGSSGASRCDALATCCAKLPDQERSGCDGAVAFGSDLVCGLVASELRCD